MIGTNYNYTFFLKLILTIFDDCSAGLEMWKRNMIEPLKDSLVKLLLEGIHQDRIGAPIATSTDIIRGVIHSFVSVQEYKKKASLEVRQYTDRISTYM